jgi:GT2 family glycosyltransferase
VIDVVVVNWNSGAHLRQCLESVDASNNGAVALVTVVDNASTDGSAQDARTYAARTFDYRLHANGQNRGFAAACNTGAALGNARFILFLNPDARLFPDALRKLGEAALELSTRGYGVLGIALRDRSGRVGRTCSRQPRPSHFWAKMLALDRVSGGLLKSHVMTEWPHADSRDVEHVIGACYLIRRDLFESLGGFDERFFLYLEDVDLSRRVLAAGLRIRYVADAFGFHEGGGSSKNVKAARLFHFFTSRILFGYKHFSPAAAWGLVAGTLFAEPFTRVAFALMRANVEELVQTVHAFTLLWRALPKLIARARRAESEAPAPISSFTGGA